MKYVFQPSTSEMQNSESSDDINGPINIDGSSNQKKMYYKKIGLNFQLYLTEALRDKT